MKMQKEANMIEQSNRKKEYDKKRLLRVKCEWMRNNSFIPSKVAKVWLWFENFINAAV